jgi:membrane-associated phospholipid phosphatase
MDLRTKLQPADRVVAGYNLVLCVVWSWQLDQAQYAGAIAVAHAAGVSLPWLLTMTPDRVSRPMQAIRDLYPLILLLAFWSELDLLRDVLALDSYDQAIITLDRWTFGVHPHELWLPRAPVLWLSEPLHFAYLAYYPLIFAPPLIIAVQGRRHVLSDMTFRLLVTYLGCYLIYMMFPSDGPYIERELVAGPHIKGLFYQFSQVTHALGDSRGCSFPSSHVAGAVTIAFMAWRWFPRWVAVLLTVEAAGVFFATTYTQSHYAIDSIAGLAWALALQTVVVPVLFTLLSPQERRPIPVLPSLVRKPSTFGGGA